MELTDLPPLTREPSRLLHRPGDLVLDYYPPLLILILYAHRGEGEIASLADRLEEFYPGHPLLIQDRSVRPFAVAGKRGKVPEEMIVTEGGLEYRLNPYRGQNMGFFIDMRDGRRIVRELAGERKGGEEFRVLNLFAYTCTFSVAALAAGATKVVNIDMNRNSLDVGRQNHRLNHSRLPGGYGGQALFLPHDIFKSFGKLRREGPYRLIIADPPPSQRGSFDLRRDYPRLLRRLPEMLDGKGRLLLSLNSPEMDWEEFEALVEGELPRFALERISPPGDFKPREEGRGLKLLLAAPRP